MELEYIHGKMGGNILGVSQTINDKDKERFNGSMGDDMRENGIMVNNMDVESILMPTERRGKENGLKAKE